MLDLTLGSLIVDDRRHNTISISTYLDITNSSISMVALAWSIFRANPRPVADTSVGGELQKFVIRDLGKR